MRLGTMGWYMADKNKQSFELLMKDLTPDFMAGVQPLKSEPVAIVSFAAAKKVDHTIRRQAATVLEHKELAMGLSDEVREWVEPAGVIEWRGDGIQKYVFRDLKLGKYGYDAKLDLHKKLVREARVDIAQFIQDCYRMNIRNALIVHGKGDRSRDRPALLKSLCYQWLIDLPLVQAFHTAQPHHGGAGATYVMLRKSEVSKIETREQNRKR